MRVASQQLTSSAQLIEALGGGWHFQPFAIVNGLTWSAANKHPNHAVTRRLE
jgi:hypothetical protein